MGSIVGQDLRDYVIKQINVRQHAHGSGIEKERTLEELTYLNSRTSWIKLVSGVTVTEEKLRSLGFEDNISDYIGTNLAKKFVLFNGTSQFDQNTLAPIEYNQFPSGYAATSDYGIVPLSGITSLEVTSLNRGSLKKATLKLKVQDREQLAIIDILYLRLGYTVLLEWGNSVYLDNSGELQILRNTILEEPNGFFKDDITYASYTEILNTIDKKREEYSANYDGMLAKISNFSWTFNEDGSYDVDLTLISWGDVIESLKTNITARKSVIDFVEEASIVEQENSIIQIKRKENVIFSLLHAYKIVNDPANKGKGETININSTPYGNFILSGSSKVTIDKFKSVFTSTSELWEYGANGTSKKVKAEQFAWFKTKLSYDERVVKGLPWSELDILAVPYGFSQAGIIQKINITVRDTPTDKNLYTTYTDSFIDFTDGGLEEWNKSSLIYSLPSSKRGPRFYNGSYSIPELYTRTNGNPGILKLNSNTFNQDLVALRQTTKGVDFSNEFFEGRELIYLDGTSIKNITNKNLISFNKTQLLTNIIYKVSEFPSGFIKYLQEVNANKTQAFNDKDIKIAINFNIPEYVFGIFGREKDNQGQLLDNINVLKQYIGLQSKFGIDDGKIFNKTTISTSKDATNSKLLNIQNKGDSTIDKLENEEFEAFKNDPANSISSQYPAPQYDPDTGFPKDDNYEFFHRFVADKEDPNKPFYWKITHTKTRKKVSSGTFNNPLLNLNHDPKGVVVLDLEPKAYYIKFGYLLQLIQEKIIFKIESTISSFNSSSKDPIINIDYSSSADMYCINSKNTGQMSYDWKTCIVRRKFSKPWDNSTPNINVFPELDPWAEEDNANITSPRLSVANSMNVYLNFDFVGRCFESNTDERGNIAVYKVINSICGGINQALGGVNNLEPVIDETTNTLRIIDSTPKYVHTVTPERRSQPYLLQLYGYTRPLEIDSGVASNYPDYDKIPYYESTFARKVDLKTAITPEYATMVTVGAAAGSNGYVKGIEATSFSKWNEGIYDRFKPTVIPPDINIANTSSAKESVEDTLQSYAQAFNVIPSCFGLI